MTIGLIGLGRMGFNLALNMRDNGHKVVCFNRSKEKVDQAIKDGLEGVFSVGELVSKLEERRIIWLMLPSGEIIDDMIKLLIPLLNKGDIIIDGGNSNYRDTLRRYRELKLQGIDFVDVGTSGGIDGARNGACTMIGAEDVVFAYIEPLFKDISVENGYLHCGENGSGHFVKMVHNGVEYGMMAAIGEGFEILKQCRFDLDFEKVARVWNNGSVIRGWLMELAENAFKKDASLDRIKGIMYSSGEGLWTVQEALELKVPATVITESLMMRYRSEQEDTFTGKVVAALRNEFGGHAVKENK